MIAQQTITLTVNGQRYERWEKIRVTRKIDRMSTDFNIAVSKRLPTSARDFPLAPLQACMFAIGRTWSWRKARLTGRR
jgi:prophage tail gpP-like protein